MTAQPVTLRQHGNAYNIFILVLTVFSLALMVLLLLPVDAETRQLLNVYDNAICVIFLVDFTYNITGSRPEVRLLHPPARLARPDGVHPELRGLPAHRAVPPRAAEPARPDPEADGRPEAQRARRDVLDNRGQYATFITILAAGMVLCVASILVLQFESRSPDANIKTGGDALWWAVVTITTVGYGDYFPVTTLGRLTGVSVMFAGVGIIGALASILASLLVPPPKQDHEPERRTSTSRADAATPAGDAARDRGRPRAAGPAPGRGQGAARGAAGKVRLANERGGPGQCP